MRSLLMVAIMFTAGVATAEEDVLVTIGADAQAFHLDYAGRQFLAHKPDDLSVGRFTEALEALQDRLSAKLDAPIFLEVPGFDNALAFIRDGQRYVLVGSEFMNMKSPELVHQNSTELMIYGHELGHHVCGHQGPERPDDAWTRELQADEVSGALARGLAERYTEDNIVTLDSLMVAASGVFSATGSQSHPPLAIRQAAVRRGWQSGPSCVAQIGK